MHPCSGRKSKFVEGMQRQWWQETRETENRALQMQLSNKNSKEEGICEKRATSRQQETTGKAILCIMYVYDGNWSSPSPMPMHIIAHNTV
jgi:hypothetical protein